MRSHNLGLTHHYSEDNPRHEWERKGARAGGTRERETSTVPMTSARTARKSDPVSHLDQPPVSHSRNNWSQIRLSRTQNEFKTVQKRKEKKIRSDQCKSTRFNYSKNWKMQVIGLKGGDQGKDHNWKGEERRMCIQTICHGDGVHHLISLLVWLVWRTTLS